MVRFLVENTLGRLWVEMHPDSRLASSLGYLVPVARPPQRPVRPIREITFLDPCCGSMHFGLLAFDLFAEMYREERENVGKPGWLATPSAASEEEIPELILSHNIHGLGIDTRAIQLSALTLILRARTLNPKTTAAAVNLASANVEQITSGRLEEFVAQAQFSHPIYERILRRLAIRLKDSDHLGSLLRIERDIRQLVDEERRRSADLLGQLPGLNSEQFDTQEGIDEFFGILTDQILRHLDNFVKATQREGKDAGLFAAEAAKGLRFLRLAEQRYDVVVTNPPYLSGRKMNKRLATLMEQEYKEGKGDLYAAFIVRCQEFLASDGLMGMLTMHSFMFISSYEELRSKLRKEIAIEILAHCGGGLFAVGNPGTLQTVAFILRRELSATLREQQTGTYFRLVKERSADSKRLSFEAELVDIEAGNNGQKTYRYKQVNFDAIPSKPWVYWISERLRRLFTELPSLGSTADVVVGLQTGDRGRFVRYWWEVGIGLVNLNLADRSHEARWIPYMKSGGAKSWYGLQYYVVNWSRAGSEIRATSSSRPQNVGHYFMAGVNFPMLTSGTFTARYSPSGFIFDNSAPSVITDDFHLPLAVLNSSLGKWLLKVINPTLNTPPGDVAKIPVPDREVINLRPLVTNILDVCIKREGHEEITWSFCKPEIGIELSELDAQQKRLEFELASQLSASYALLPDEVAAIENSLSEAPLIVDDGDTTTELEEVDREDGSNLPNPTATARRWLSYALGTALGRFEIGSSNRFGCGDFPEATASQIRFLIDPNGIMPCEAGHPQDLAARAFACLELMLGSGPARDAVFNATFTAGDSIEALRGWLDRFTGTPAASFWKYHHQLYRKRPVYWPFQSPKKTYTVWVFHEKLGPNTLHTVKEFIDVRLNLLERSEIPPLRLAAATNRAKERELQKALEQSDGLREFATRLQAHIEGGYQSCIDDGVLLNAAPLHNLFPSWPDTRKACEELKAGKYDWAQQAMRHWPDRVTEACRTNRSFAIAHGLQNLCPAAPARTAQPRGRQPADLTDIV